VSKLSKKKKAFSLAEILLTITVIGIVASMTVPQLVISIQKQQYSTAFKKTYGVFSQAAKLYADENEGKIPHTSTTNVYINSLSSSGLGKYLNVAQYCAGDNLYVYGHCWHDERLGKATTLNKIPYYWWQWEGIVLNDGTLIHSEDPNFANSSNPIISYYMIDVNGFKPPNVVGKDMFAITLAEDGRVSPGYLVYNAQGRVGLGYPVWSYYPSQLCKKTCNTGDNAGIWACGSQCAYYIMANSNNIFWY